MLQPVEQIWHEGTSPRWRCCCCESVMGFVWRCQCLLAGAECGPCRGVEAASKMILLQRLGERVHGCQILHRTSPGLCDRCSSHEGLWFHNLHFPYVI
jgi:hypothetical protein